MKLKKRKDTLQIFKSTLVRPPPTHPSDPNILEMKTVKPRMVTVLAEVI